MEPDTLGGGRRAALAASSVEVRENGRLVRDVRLTPVAASGLRFGAILAVDASPDGRLVSGEEWTAERANWLPTPDDAAFVHSLMQPVIEPGKMAGWVAPPSVGINGKPVEFEYVRVA